MGDGAHLGIVLVTVVSFLGYMVASGYREQAKLGVWPALAFLCVIVVVIVHNLS